LAARDENAVIDIANIKCPKSSKVLIEGAGGLLVPINDKVMMIDLIKYLNAAVILVVSSKLGTINHSLLSIEALRARKIPILGVILSGPINQDNADSIQTFGNVEILAQVPNFDTISAQEIKAFPLSKKLKQLLETEHEILATT
jgi:dethiobiotin synthetase